MNSKEQEAQISLMRKQAIRTYNMAVLKAGENLFRREHQSKGEKEELPMMCSGCRGFFCKRYKSRHQLICPAAGTNMLVLMVSMTLQDSEKYPADFISLLNTLHLDDIGSRVKSDKIILMIGARSTENASLKRKKTKLQKRKSQ